MIKQYSFGIVPLRRKSEEWEVLLIQHHAGHWAFPKGHEEEGESPKQTAERELKEETGLTVARYLTEEPLTESYFFFFQKQRIYKTVQYFLAEVKGRIHIQEAEILNSQWISLSEAKDQITFEESKKMCLQVQQFLEFEGTSF